MSNKNLLTISTAGNSFSTPFQQIPTIWNPFFKVYSNVSLPPIRKVIYQKEHTIVIWEDGEKTVVKCSEESFDKEKGLAMAIAKRFMDRNKFKKLIKDADIQDK